MPALMDKQISIDGRGGPNVCNARASKTTAISFGDKLKQDPQTKGEFGSAAGENYELMTPPTVRVVTYIESW